MARLWSAGIDVHVDRRLAMPPRAAASRRLREPVTVPASSRRWMRVFSLRPRVAVSAMAMSLSMSDRWLIRMPPTSRSEEHTSELQSLMRISYAVFCLKKKKKKNNNIYHNIDRQTQTPKENNK